ncbi:hypothetical protein GGD65_006323 [Bradyrhizobium sp. CIR18]|uniref:IS66 family transposase n=1 Tax=Bradyrhizobium sp. CIR18 TaxID=2663839 RepID=UPI0017E3E1B6|nr:transposase [Bradyrhizobium sp. CIR18]MBB4365257.1 hypothetical protein [Bradyrhizobium sp. CIR18]
MQAIRYTLNHSDGLTRFIDDGRIEIDSNTVERSIKPIRPEKKNYLFGGSEGGAQTGPFSPRSSTRQSHKTSTRGTTDRCSRAHHLRTYQDQSAAHAAAVECCASWSPLVLDKGLAVCRVDILQLESAKLAFANTVVTSSSRTVQSGTPIGIASLMAALRYHRCVPRKKPFRRSKVCSEGTPGRSENLPETLGPPQVGGGRYSRSSNAAPTASFNAESVAWF